MPTRMYWRFTDHYRKDNNSFENTKAITYQCLKEVENTGFRGNKNDMELIGYFLKNATTLKKLTIDPCCMKLHGERWYREKDEEMLKARFSPEMLQLWGFVDVIPPNVQIILRD